MKLDFFDSIAKETKNITKELAFHVVGDPLIASNLNDFLDISHKNALKVNITTTANNLNNNMHETLMHKGLKQINFSINSYNANSHKKTLQEYLKPIFDYILYANKQKQNHFINLRIWNLDDSQSAKAFNQEVFDYANEVFNSDIKLEEVYEQRPKNIKVAPKVFFNFDDYFEWPSLKNDFVSDTGFCYGLDSHFSVLASGTVTPCCLDKDGIINLGNLHEQSLDEILSSKRVKAIQKGFANNKVVEELCQKCSYRQRFDEA